jgi:A118 family predicted phage portal protein
MFAKILQWLREVWLKMINKADVKSRLQIDVAISNEMVTALQEWTNIYTNHAPWLDKDIRSLNLGAGISGELSRSITMEMSTKLTGGARAEFLQTQIDPVVLKLREQIEYACAKGGLMMKPYVDKDKITVDFVQADQFYPVEFDSSGHIISCVFSDQRTIGDKFYVRLEFHRMTKTGSTIINRAFKSTGKNTLGSEIPLTEVDVWAQLVPEAEVQNIDKPLFAYFRFPQANNIDPTSPLGVSCFARAVDQIKQADIQWSNLLWEFESGQRALYVDELAFGKDKNGKPILPNKRLYRTLQGGAPVGKEDMFEDWTPDLRETNIIAGLEAMLRKIEFTCGLSYGTLSNPQTVDKTATELKISQQRFYSTVTDAQKALSQAMDELLYAMDVWVTLEGLAPVGTYSAVYDFDDSVVVDKEVQFLQDSRMVTLGVMSKQEFRMRNMGEDEATAAEALLKVEAEQPELDEFGMPIKKKPIQPGGKDVDVRKEKTKSLRKEKG